MVGEKWLRVLHAVPDAAAGAPLLLYGSRSPRWSEDATPSSDYDVIVVRDGDRAWKRTITPEAGLHIDLTVLSRRAMWNGRLMSPQQHVADRWGEHIGDWTWYDPEMPLSWLGADTARETLECEAEVALGARDDVVWLCGFGIRILRRGLTLLSATGALGEAAPTWATVTNHYGLPADLVAAVRAAEALVDDARSRAWAGLVAAALKHAMDEIRASVMAYPKNRADAMVEERLAGARA